MKTEHAHPITKTPEGYTAVTPWIISRDTEKLIGFLTKAFEAEEIPNSRITGEDGKIIHVVVKIGDALVMLFDSREGWPQTPVFLNLYVDDVEKTCEKAIELGATSVTDITELWFGEKVSRLLDPFGNLWWINERVEEVDFTDPEAAKRGKTPQAMKGIAYIQKSLNEALLKQKEFFAKN